MANTTSDSEQMTRDFPGGSRPQKPRIFIDISGISAYGRRHRRVSGIQRVVLSVAAHMLHSLPDSADVTAVWFRQRDKCFWQVKRSMFAPGTPFDPERLSAGLGYESFYRNVTVKHRDRPLKLLEKRLLSKLDTLVTPRSWRDRGSGIGDKVQFRPGDRLLFAGLGWQEPGVMAALKRVQENRGVIVYILVHDLIPIFSDDKAMTKFAGQFQYWFEDVSRYFRNFLTYSEHTHCDLLKAWSAMAHPAGNVFVTPLAHEIMSHETEVIGTPVRALGQEDYVLMVGPVLGRKNGGMLLDVWQRLLEEFTPEQVPRLVYAGDHRNLKIWQHRNVASRPDVMRHVRFIDRPSDSELEYLYRHCLFSTFPSSYEGWGLPVGESLWAGRLCVASSLTSIPEVAGALADYADPHDFEALLAAIRRPIVDRAYLARRTVAIRRASLRTWRETAQSFYEALSRDPAR